MVDHSVMQQNTSWWLLGEDRIDDATIDSKTLSGLGTSEGGPGRSGGRLPQSGGTGGGVRGRLALPGFSEERVSRAQQRLHAHMWRNPHLLCWCYIESHFFKEQHIIRTINFPAKVIFAGISYSINLRLPRG